MNRPLFALIVIVIVAVILLAMWLGWRARTRRDASILTASEAPKAAQLASFERVFYVSTTPVGEPLSRVAVRGLRYRGRAEVSVYEDGVTVEVDGEDAVHISAGQLRGSGVAARRVGKAVEQGGLALMLWAPLQALAAESEIPVLESSFRFDHGDDHTRFTAVIDQISASHSATQEGTQ